jgi:hypothetical protein
VLVDLPTVADLQRIVDPRPFLLHLRRYENMTANVTKLQEYPQGNINNIIPLFYEHAMLRVDISWFKRMLRVRLRNWPDLSLGEVRRGAILTLTE